MVPASLGMKMEVEYFIVGNSFGSHSARCQANNDLKSLNRHKDKNESEKCQNTIENRDELNVLIGLVS